MRAREKKGREREMVSVIVTPLSSGAKKYECSFCDYCSCCLLRIFPLWLLIKSRSSQIMEIVMKTGSTILKALVTRVQYFAMMQYVYLTLSFQTTHIYNITYVKLNHCNTKTLTQFCFCDEGFSWVKERVAAI